MTEIPEWAVQEALRRCGIGADNADFSEWRDCTYAKAVRNLANMIAKRETKPVDPYEEAVKSIFMAAGVGPDEVTIKNFSRAVAQYKKERLTRTLLMQCCQMQNAEHMDATDKAEWARRKRVIAECRKMQHRIRARIHEGPKRCPCGV